jgi:hypothetical protein
MRGAPSAENEFDVLAIDVITPAIVSLTWKLMAACKEVAEWM